jgi:hypothetical protein
MSVVINTSLEDLDVDYVTIFGLFVTFNLTKKRQMGCSTREFFINNDTR